MTEESPFVSIILPTFNRADVISRAIESVLNQTYSAYELIIVDDGSTDKTVELVSQYGSGIRYIKQSNSGVSAARNAGIRASTGQYIAFIDSDDAWMADKLAIQVKYFQDNEHLKIGLVCTDVNLIGLDGNRFEKKRKARRSASCVIDFMTLLKDPYLGLPTVMVRADLVSNNNVFDETLKTAEDIDLYLRLGMNHSIGYIHNKLVEVYVSQNSLSDSAQSYQDNIQVMERYRNSCQLTDYKQLYNCVLHSIYMDYAKYLLWTGRTKQCRDIISRSFSYKISIKAIYYFIKSLLKTKQ